MCSENHILKIESREQKQKTKKIIHIENERLRKEEKLAKISQFHEKKKHIFKIREK